MTPLMFRAPEGPAAREARRPHFVRRRASKPARALRSLRRPPHQWGRVAVWWFGASARCPVRPRHRPRAPQPGSVGQVGRLSETAVAFARLYLCGIETVIAFAGEEWAFLVRFSVAEVSSVSTLAVWGRAVVMVVSRWSASAVAEVLLVSTSPCCCVLRTKKFTLHRFWMQCGATKRFVRASSAAPRSRPFRCRRSTGACGRSAGAPRLSRPSPPVPPTSGHPTPARSALASRVRGSA